MTMTSNASPEALGKKVRLFHNLIVQRGEASKTKAKAELLAFIQDKMLVSNQREALQLLRPLTVGIDAEACRAALLEYPPGGYGFIGGVAAGS